MDGATASWPAALRDTARAVALARVLPRMQQRGRAAAEELRSRLARAADGGAGPDAGEHAALLADAEAVSRLLDSGAPADAQRHAGKLAREAVDALPSGLITAEAADRAVAAAGAVARLRCLAAALPRSPADASAAASAGQLQPITEAVARRAAGAALARAALAELDFRLPELELAAEQLAAEELAAAEPAPAPSTAGPGARTRLRRRLAAARRRRARRADRLTQRLLARAERHLPAGPYAPVGPPAAPADPVLLAWLRRHTTPGLYTPQTEHEIVEWLGADPFGRRELPAPPPFLTGLDPAALAPGQVAPFLRRICLTRRPPTPAELTPEALEADRGTVSELPRTPELRFWGQPPEPGTPLLPAVTRLPHVVHGVWVGKPLPADSVFWRNYGEAARRYAGRVDFVLWTDVPRERFERARATPPPPNGRRDPLAYVRRLLDWAEHSGIRLVDIFEVFHRDAPMRLHRQAVLELAKQLPRGYASFGDLLRVELLERFGGAYVDGDIGFADGPGAEPLPAFFDRIAGSVHGFTVNPRPGGVDNDAIVAPAGHPAIRLWTERARLNYCRTQPEIFGSLRHMAGRWIGETARYLAPARTGCVQYQVVALLGIPYLDLPSTGPALRIGHELSWTPPPTGEPAQPVARTEEEVLQVLAGLVTFLRWQLIARRGDLYLSAVDPVVRGLPDPDAAWTALLRVLPRLDGDGAPAVASVTDLRRNDDGRLERVALPPEAEALLDRHPPAGPWIGAPLSPAGRPVWLLDEQVERARLRTVQPVPDRAAVLAPYTEVALDPFGRTLGLWLRSPRTAAFWRHDGRFAGLLPGQLGIALGSSPHEDWIHDLELRPEDLALLLLDLGAADRPIRLVTPAVDAARDLAFAARLEELLGRPVQFAADLLRSLPVPPPGPPIVPPVSYRAAAAELWRGPGTGGAG
ncbi:hypothetical protein AB0K43_24120 [Kitasatospora sp. NPDC049258]|uniref:hypothetical protein n=1 Tax=Kitasatospora sp. NPDC049258 TaxID=3155394 RepID=UPI00341E1E75